LVKITETVIVTLTSGPCGKLEWYFWRLLIDSRSNPAGMYRVLNNRTVFKTSFNAYGKNQCPSSIGAKILPCPLFKNRPMGRMYVHPCTYNDVKGVTDGTIVETVANLIYFNEECTCQPPPPVEAEMIYQMVCVATLQQKWLSLTMEGLSACQGECVKNSPK
jgi:hypothetical protein